MAKSNIMEGVFAINKPTGISSAQVLRDLQHHFNPSELFAPWIENEKAKRGRENSNQQKRRKDKRIQVKIGHGGTLDPLATGVLIAGVGAGTKSLQDFLLCTKVYEAVVLFGTSTDTYDRVGKVLRRAPYEHITKDAVEEALGQFRGKFKQLPPLFSALKMNGKPLYEYAREGKEIPREIERRDVEVLSLEMVEWLEGGTHSHEAPTDEAGHADINIANKLWKQEGVLPASEEDPFAGKNAHLGKAVEAAEEEEAIVEKAEMKTPDASAHEESGSKKRKIEDGDDIVHEKPASKQLKKEETLDDVKMSGGLQSPPQAKSEEVLEEKIKGPPACRITMTVTSGFYVRSLCHDLGAAVGSAALMAELQRTRQGQFELGKNVLEAEDLKNGEKAWGPKVEAMLNEWNEPKSKTEESPKSALKADEASEAGEAMKAEQAQEAKEEPKAE